MKIYINDNQMGVITKNCKAKSLLPGARHIAPWKNLIIVNDKLSYEESAFLFDNYSCSKKLVDNTETLVVKEGEFAIRFVDDVYTGSYKPGTYHFLKSSSAKVVKTFDKNVLLIKDLPNRIATDLIKKEIATRAIVGPNEKGALFINNKFHKIIEPGEYYLNNLNIALSVKAYPSNITTILSQNQELLTKDKVNLRINFWVDYLITDLEKLVTTIGESYYDHLYNLVQMALRSVICDKTLDEILLEKEKISKDILSYLKSYESKYFVSFEDAGIKDIILPGEIKDILNTVLIAEKQAQANVITRREETASTRSLLNTAKLMEENDVLYRLKELEMLERIFDKVGNINVDGGNFIESLENIVGTRRKEK